MNRTYSQFSRLALGLPLLNRSTMNEPVMPYERMDRVDDARFETRVHGVIAEIRAQGAAFDLGAEDFDRSFFGDALGVRHMDPRIRQVIDTIKRQPSAMAAAEDCAQQVGLSFSRFLHLFRDDVGAPFRSFRTWKRARSLLHHVNRGSNLAHVALDTGYPDSTHFSHSIRQDRKSVV